MTCECGVICEWRMFCDWRGLGDWDSSIFFSQCISRGKVFNWPTMGSSPKKSSPSTTCRCDCKGSYLATSMKSVNSTSASVWCCLWRALRVSILNTPFLFFFLEFLLSICKAVPIGLLFLALLLLFFASVKLGLLLFYPRGISILESPLSGD